MKSKRKKTKKKPQKKKLLDQVIQLTGITSQTIRRELLTILSKKNIRPQDITLDQLRVVAAAYLREIMGGLIDNGHMRRSDRQH
ncbi:MAG: hypothetical protein EB078_08360 [Proteobacteria bacterium]|nr:hypothetical protein [Pseudomonadota bacterium]NDC25043.1 hypothetical protein [Pseudomonadota bacterium]NDD04904.1 hypothetical protein [Pseudomonadota bacterium]NDG27748.1 hypothetical protein [Pseudomonadota bacterium]